MKVGQRVAIAAVGMVILAFGYAETSSAAVWRSGEITLPDGTAAGVGDVVGWVFESYRPEVLEINNFYEQIHNGLEPGVGSSRTEKGYLTDYFIERVESDANGVVTVGSGEMKPEWGANMWAKVIYICEYDGYEYIKSVNASCEPVAAYPVYNNDYLASRAGSPWRQGYALSAIPEPTAGVLLLVGCAAVLLRRRVRCARSVDCSFTPATGCAPVRGCQFV